MPYWQASLFERSLKSPLQKLPTPRYWQRTQVLDRRISQASHACICHFKSWWRKWATQVTPWPAPEGTQHCYPAPLARANFTKATRYPLVVSEGKNILWGAHPDIQNSTLNPSYFSELLKWYNALWTPYSANELLFTTPTVRQQFVERAIPTTASKLWNSIPKDIRASTSLHVLKRGQKTFLFNAWFSCM